MKRKQDVHHEIKFRDVQDPTQLTYEIIRPVILGGETPISSLRDLR